MGNCTLFAWLQAFMWQFTFESFLQVLRVYQAPNVRFNCSFLYNYIQCTHIEDCKYAAKTVWQASEQGNLTRVQECLEELGIHVDARDPLGATPLIVASKAGQEEVVRYLLDAGADVDCQDGEGWTSLMYSCMFLKLSICDILLDRNANIHLKNATEGTCLLLSAHANAPVALVERLLDMGADINHRQRYGFTALLFAVSGGYPEIAELLIRRGADVHLNNNIFGTCPIHVAVNNGDTCITKLLLDSGSPLNPRSARSMTPLMIASARGQLDLVELLLERGAPVNEQEGPPTSSDVIDSFTQVSQEVRQALSLPQVFELEIFVERVGRGSTALHMAVKQGDVEVVKTLMSYGADPNLRNDRGESALDMANETIIDALVQGEGVSM